MTPHYQDATVRLFHGDCLDVLRELPDASIDSVCTDPPYGLEFMGKDWDKFDSSGANKAKFRKPSERDHERGAEQDGMTVRMRSVPEAYVAGSAFQDWCGLWAAECLRVLKPGGHMVAFGGTRTWHRLACAVEDAGFEIRDSIAWLFGSGFPKSLDVSKAIDKQRTEDRAPVDAVRAWLNARRIEAGYSHDAVNKHFGHASNGGGSSSAWMTNPTSKSLPTWEQWLELKRIFSFADDVDAEVWRLNGRKGKPGDNFEAREVVGEKQAGMGTGQTFGMLQSEGRNGEGPRVVDITAPATPEAARWQGWGTALKPGFEPVVVARKPLVGTVAATVTAYGTGALNIDACRIEGEPWKAHDATGLGSVKYFTEGDTPVIHKEPHTAGRWPANVVLDETQATALDHMSGELSSGANPTRRGADGDRTAYGGFAGQEDANPQRGTDVGGASRFFFVAREESSCPNPDLANTAATTSSPRNASGGSAPSGAATSASRDISQPTLSASTSAKGTASRPNGESGTPPTPTTDAASSPAPRPAKPTPIPNPANSAEPPAPTDTTTTTTSPSTSDGSAAPATSSTTPTNSAPGDPDSLPSRFLYEPKAPTVERPRVNGISHPTTKPLDLMRWLIRLITPPGGTILEPFAGSGTTVEAAILEGFPCIAIERETDYLPLITQRINRRRDPIAAIRATGDDGGLFDLLDEEESA